MDLGLVKERYGNRICLLGNIDVSHVLLFGTLEIVAEEVRKCIIAAAQVGGNFPVSSNSIYSGIPPMNVLAIYRAGLRYGRYAPKYFLDNEIFSKLIHRI
ncbi:MAG: hypothetical protein ACUVTL_08010 [Thermoproteota archaeon]